MPEYVVELHQCQRFFFFFFLYSFFFVGWFIIFFFSCTLFIALANCVGIWWLSNLSSCRSIDWEIIILMRNLIILKLLLNEYIFVLYCEMNLYFMLWINFCLLIKCSWLNRGFMSIKYYIVYFICEICCETNN